MVLSIKFIRNMSFKSNKPSLKILNSIMPQKKSDAAASSSSQSIGVPDIEDVVGALKVKSEYFSPLQTRQQRKILNKPLKLREVTNLKQIKLENNKTAIKQEVRVKQELEDDDEINEKLSQPFNKLENAMDSKVSIKTAIKQEVRVKQELEDDDEINEKISQSWEPENWQTILNNIRKMRASNLAPVDTMGCHKCSDEIEDNKTRRFHVLVSLMLSSQTKDETTFAAVGRLRNQTFTPDSIANMEASMLEDLIKPVSFYKTKAKHLQLVSHILIEKYNSDIPDKFAELIKLPGVGPKMAHLCMSEAWNQISGIGVDVHVHRISNRLKWLPKETKKPEETRVLLESWLPRTLWRDVNHLLVGFGQTICTPVNPKCSLCLNCTICPSAGIVKDNKPKKVQSRKLKI